MAGNGHLKNNINENSAAKPLAIRSSSVENGREESDATHYRLRSDLHPKKYFICRSCYLSFEGTSLMQVYEHFGEKEHTSYFSLCLYCQGKIAPVTYEEIVGQQELESIVNEDTDFDYIYDELHTGDEDSMDNYAPDNGSQSESEIFPSKSEVIKFEIVNVDSEEKHSDKEFWSECKNTDSKQEKLPQNSKKAEEICANTNFICEYCGKYYKTEASRKRHMAVHSMEKYLCDVCPRTFTDSCSLVKHKKTHDENRKRDFACQRCGLKFLTSHTLKGHQEIHNNEREKRFQCDQCEKAFFHRGALNVHRRIHTGDMVQCEICDKRYPREVDLELHMRSHTGEQPFKCTTCGKAFKYNSTLYNHVRKAHFGYFKCSYCSKQYKDKQALIEHKRLHKNFAFKCALCDKEMAKKYQIKCHIKSIHKIESIQEIEELVISNKAENKHRTMRTFTDVEYKDHITIPESCKNSRLKKFRRRNMSRKKTEDQSSDGNESE